jgi:hypothetical protein
LELHRVWRAFTVFVQGSSSHLLTAQHTDNLLWHSWVKVAAAAVMVVVMVVVMMVVVMVAVMMVAVMVAVIVAVMVATGVTLRDILHRQQHYFQLTLQA